MKFLIVSGMFVSFSVMAVCPNLAGEYTSCRSQSGELTSGSTISQEMTNGVTTYTVVSIDDESGSEVTETFIADGVLRADTFPDPSGKVTIASLASCQGNALVLDLKVFSEFQEFANLHFQIIKIGHQITTLTTGTASGGQVNDTEVCL